MCQNLLTLQSFDNRHQTNTCTQRPFSSKSNSNSRVHTGDMHALKDHIKATADTGDISQLQAMQQQSIETFAEWLNAREQRHTTERCLAVARRLATHVERVRYVLNEEPLQLITAQNKSAWAYTMVDCVLLPKSEMARVAVSYLN